MLPIVQCILHLLNGVETSNMITLLLLQPLVSYAYSNFTGGYDVLERYADAAVNSICDNRYFHTTNHYRNRNIPSVSAGVNILILYIHK